MHVPISLGMLESWFSRIERTPKFLKGIVFREMAPTDYIQKRKWNDFPISFLSNQTCSKEALRLYRGSAWLSLDAGEQAWAKNIQKHL